MTIFTFIHQAVKCTFLFTKIKVLSHVHARDKKKNFENYATAPHKTLLSSRIEMSSIHVGRHCKDTIKSNLDLRMKRMFYQL